MGYLLTVGFKADRDANKLYGKPIVSPDIKPERI